MAGQVFYQHQGCCGGGQGISICDLVALPLGIVLSVERKKFGSCLVGLKELTDNAWRRLGMMGPTEIKTLAFKRCIALLPRDIESHEEDLRLGYMLVCAYLSSHIYIRARVAKESSITIETLHGIFCHSALVFSLCPLSMDLHDKIRLRNSS